MKKIKIICAIFIFLMIMPALHAFYLSSTLPLYLGLPFESDVIDEAKHNTLFGFNWNIYFGGHFGLGVDADFFLGGSDGMKVYGGFCGLYHFSDVWTKKGVKFDPFIGLGIGWTDAPGYYEGSGINASYVPVVEFTGMIQAGFNYWFSDSVGLICKTKLYFNRWFDLLQINAGINIKLFSANIKMK